jgi:hypothetical protein
MENKAVKGSTARRPAAPASSAKSKGEPVKEGPLEWIRSFAIAVLLFLVVRTFLIQAFTIPSGSMEDTLLVGDYLMANNAIYGRTSRSRTCGCPPSGSRATGTWWCSGRSTTSR